MYSTLKAYSRAHETVTMYLDRWTCYLFCTFFFRTFKQDCPMHISLRASNDGQSLEVKSVSYDHNHDFNKVCVHSCSISARVLQISASVDEMNFLIALWKSNRYRWKQQILAVTKIYRTGTLTRDLTVVWCLFYRESLQTPTQTSYFQKLECLMYSAAAIVWVYLYLVLRNCFRNAKTSFKTSINVQPHSPFNVSVYV